MCKTAYSPRVEIGILLIMETPPPNLEADELRRKRIALQDEMYYLRDRMPSLETGASASTRADHVKRVRATSEKISEILAELRRIESRLAKLSVGNEV